MNEQEDMQSTFAEWFGSVEEQGELTSITLNHVQGAGGAVEIHSMKEGKGPWKDAAKMAAAILAVADRHARGIVGGGMQQFQIEASFGAAAKPTRFHPFMRMGAPSYGGGSATGSLATEMPTPTGQLQQTMRQGELLFQGSFRQNEMNAATQREIIKELRADNRYLMGEYVSLREALFKTMEALKQLQYDHALKLAEFLRNTKERERWQMILPAAVNAVTGRDVFPQSFADSSAFESLYDSLPPEGRQKMLQDVTARGFPERASIIAARFAELDRNRRIAKDELDRMLEESKQALSMEEIIAEGAGDILERGRRKQIRAESESAADAPADAKTEPAPPPTVPVPVLENADIDLRWPIRAGAKVDEVLAGVAAMISEAAAKNNLTSVTDDGVTHYTGNEGVMAGVRASWSAGRLEFEAVSGKAEGMKGIGTVNADGIRIQVVLPGLLRLFKDAVEKRIRQEAAAIIGTPA